MFLAWKQNLDNVSNDPSNPTVLEVFMNTIHSDNPVTGICFFGTRGWRNAFTCNDSDDIGATVSPGYLSTGCLSEQSYDGLIAWERYC